MFAKDKHSSLLGTFVRYEENEVLWKQSLVPSDLIIGKFQPLHTTLNQLYLSKTNNQESRADVINILQL